VIHLSVDPGFLQHPDRTVTHAALSNPRGDCAAANCR
jgi:hypothetical protein